MPPTVLLVGAFPFPTGQGSQVYVGGMARALARAGVSVVLACYATGDGPVPRDVDVVRTPRVPGKPFLGSGPHWSKVPHDAALVRNLARVLRRRRIDVVHAHNVEAPVAAWLAMRASGVRRPLVYNLHTAMAEELPTYARSGRRLAALAGEAVDRVVPRLADASIAISEASADHLRRMGARRVELVPPGIDLADLAGADADRARRRWELGERPWIAYTGNADAYQDLPVLFRAVARLPDAGLLLVTGGDTGALERLADEVGLPAARRRLVTGGFGDAKDALAASAAAAIPRVRCAGFPIKLLNQLGLGVPTVCARGSARPIDGVIPVDDGDDAAMAVALAALVADPARRRALGDAARAAVAREWSWDVRAERLRALYEEISSPSVTPARPSS